jgi:hypothetical protein
MTARWTLLLLTCAMTFSTVGCAKYTLRRARAVKLDPGSKIAVSVWSPRSKGAAPDAMEGYLTAALVGRDFDVRTIQLELIAGRSLLHRALPEGTYAAREAMVRGMARGGELDVSPAELSALLRVNELDDGKRRMKLLAELAAMVPKQWGVDYLLAVHQFDTFGYAAYTIQLKTRRVINVVVVSGNREGISGALGAPKKGKFSMNAQDGDVSRLELLRLAEYIASGL